ncbi:MAG: transcriptional regulator BetI [Pseudomonadota bacterium]
MSVESQRRAQLVEATIREIGTVGSLDVTVGQIAKRAGVSSALAFHYFGGKDSLLLAAMQHTLTIYGAQVRGALAMSHGPRERLEAVIRVSFIPTNFRSDVIAAWLNFYVLAQRSERARRLLTIYHRRLHSNLVHDLKPLIGDRAPVVAERLGGLIDGLYVRSAITPKRVSGEDATAHVLAALDRELDAA